MQKTIVKLTVFFEAPFWVCVYERECAGMYEACKITFGAEPKDYEVWGFLLKKYNSLRFSRAANGGTVTEKHINPKRRQRKISRQLQNTGVGTKAQQALRLWQEQGKLERRVRSRAKRESEKERRFDLKQKKRKEKHRGH